MYCRIMIAVLVCCMVASSTSADGPHWPQWRGPQGTGKTAASGPTTWGPDENVQWRINLPEPGNSTPVVWGDRVFLTQAISDSNERALICVDRATGEELWRRSVAYAEPEPTHKTNPYCSASPVTDGERVIAWFGSAGLVCWDLEGNELWRRDLGQQEHIWGYGSSPILHDDLCILNFGPGSREFLIGLDKTSGETRWQVDSLTDEAERQLSGPENDGSADDFTNNKQRSERLRGSWNTPIIVQVDGHDELVVALPRRVTAFDPRTGEQLWSCGGGAPLAYASLIESDGVVVALGGYRGASFAVRTGGRGDVTQTHRLWHKPRDIGWLGTGVAHKGAIYVCDMGGVMYCFDIQTGEELWKSRAEGGGSWSSMTQTGNGLVYLLSQSGSTVVFRPDRERFQQVAINELNESTNSSVVVSDGDALIRTHQSLWCFDASENDASASTRP